MPQPQGPAGLATVVFARFDGGDHSFDEGARVLDDLEGDGFYLVGTVRQRRDRRSDTWIARLDRDGVPVWHYLRAPPPGSLGRHVDVASTSAGVVFSYEVYGDLGPGASRVLVALAGDGQMRWERPCGGQGASNTCLSGLAVDDVGRLLVGADRAVLRHSAGGDFEERMDVDLGAPTDELAVRADGSLLFIGRSGYGRTLVLDAATPSGDPLWRRKFDPPGRTPLQVGLAVAPDGRIAFGGRGYVSGGSYQGFGWVTSADGTSLFELSGDNLGIGGLAFDAAGDLYVGSTEDSSERGVTVTRRTRLGPDGSVRWSAVRPVLPYDPAGPREQTTGAVEIDGRVVFVGEGPSSQRRDLDVFVEVLHETETAAALEPPPPTERVIPPDVITAMCAGSDTEPSFDACGVSVRVKTLPPSGGFEVTPGPPGEESPGAVSMVDGELFFRSGSDEPPSRHWQPVGALGVASWGDTVVIVSSESVAVVDASAPEAPAVRCFPAPAGEPFSGPVAVNERWIVVAAGSVDGAGSLLWYFDRGAEGLAPIAIPTARTLTAPVIDGDRLFMGNYARVRLFTLDADGPKLAALMERGVAYPPGEILIAGGFAIDRAGLIGWDLEAGLGVYVATPRDCGIDMVVAGGDTGFSVIPGRADRLALGADLGCLAPAGGGGVAAEPNGVRAAVLGAGRLAVVEGSAVVASLSTDATSVGWLGGKVVLEWSARACGLSCKPTRWEVRSPELGAPETVLSPGYVVAESDDDVRRWLVTYPDGQFPSDDGGGSGPIGLAYFDPATGGVIGIDSPSADLFGVAAAPGRLYAMAHSGRIWRLDPSGSVLAEADMGGAPFDSNALAVPGLGLFVRDYAGRIRWFDESLASVRTTIGCFPATLAAAGQQRLYSVEPLGGSSSGPAGAVVQALEAVPTSATTFELEPRATWSADGQPVGLASHAGGLWVFGRDLVHLVPTP
ncbi:MAG: hypothetical protein IV100_32630 [Myxococcales bacterium]|nr:hypothetical protein [Myxococcales bacterium]